MAMVDEKYEEALVQGLQEAFSDISDNVALFSDIKDAVLANIPNLDNVLTSGQQTALNTALADLQNIVNGTVFTTVNGKPSHPSHNWRNILGL
jgi:hypothetical protein